MTLPDQGERVERVFRVLATTGGLARWDEDELTELAQRIVAAVDRPAPDEDER